MKVLALTQQLDDSMPFTYWAIAAQPPMDVQRWSRKTFEKSLE
jgi:hypothetical protein